LASFFIGTAHDYCSILNTTYQSIKSADPDALVVQGGMAGVMQEHILFWKDVFALGGDEYFEIGNIHSINSDSEAINSPEFKIFLDNQSIDKPFWITEVELDFLDYDVYKNRSDFIVKSIVSAFAYEAEKIFLPGIMKSKDKEEQYKIIEVLVKKLNYFDKCEQLDDDQFKFISGDKVIYVLWGKDVPQDIIGQVSVTDCSGHEIVMNAEDIILTDSPIFVELL
jgi:hypothetical protein